MHSSNMGYSLKTGPVLKNAAGASHLARATLSPTALSPICAVCLRDEPVNEFVLWKSPKLALPLSISCVFRLTKFPHLNFT